MLNFYPSSNPEGGFEQKLVLLFNALDLIWVKIEYKIYLLYKLILEIIELGSDFNRRHLTIKFKKPLNINDFKNFFYWLKFSTFLFYKAVPLIFTRYG